jgi:hypothetical protein
MHENARPAPAVRDAFLAGLRADAAFAQRARGRDGSSGSEEFDIHGVRHEGFRLLSGDTDGLAADTEPSLRRNLVFLQTRDISPSFLKPDA